MNLIENTKLAVEFLEGNIITVESYLNDMKMKLEEMKADLNISEDIKIDEFLADTFCVSRKNNSEEFMRIAEKITKKARFFESILIDDVNNNREKLAFVNNDFLKEILVERLKSSNFDSFFKLSSYILRNFTNLTENSIEYLQTNRENTIIFREMFYDKADVIADYIIHNDLCYEVFCNETDRDYTDYVEDMENGYSVYKVNSEK